MSKCPDAQKCETLFTPSLLKLSPIVNFTLSFIASEPKSDEFECMHGQDECIGNKQQLCIQNMYSQIIFLKFLQCQTKQFHIIPNNGEQCAKEVAGDVIIWSDVQSCVTSTKANELFRTSLKRTRSALAKKSCTIHLNGKFWCMHDGIWSKCSEGNDEMSLMKAICARFKGKHKPVDCAAFI
jgi:hypothetical protein